MTKIRIYAMLVAAAALFPSAGRAEAWWDCFHVCNGVSCVVANIEAFEQEIGGCANHADTGVAGAAAPGTYCERTQTLGLTGEVKTYLSCAAGDCSITGKFLCPQPSGGFKPVPVTLNCPSKNGAAPEASTDGDFAFCVYSDGSYRLAECNSGGGVSTLYVP